MRERRRKRKSERERTIDRHRRLAIAFSLGEKENHLRISSLFSTAHFLPSISNVLLRSCRVIPSKLITVCVYISVYICVMKFFDFYDRETWFHERKVRDTLETWLQYSVRVHLSVPITHLCKLHLSYSDVCMNKLYVPQLTHITSMKLWVHTHAKE